MKFDVITSILSVFKTKKRKSIKGKKITKKEGKMYFIKMGKCICLKTFNPYERGFLGINKAGQFYVNVIVDTSITRMINVIIIVVFTKTNTKVWQPKMEEMKKVNNRYIGLFQWEIN